MALDLWMVGLTLLLTAVSVLYVAVLRKLP
jgi:hypothetical protein